MRDVILTSIDESVVILLVGFGAIPFAREMHRGDTFRAPGAVMVQGNILQGSNCRMEQLLFNKVETLYRGNNIALQTLI